LSASRASCSFSSAGRSTREPIETWRQYEPLFHTYSTSTITPELLAALAQVESTGNPVARTYWRWQLTWNPFAVYKPASSAVGMYQMTDAAYAEAARYCRLLGITRFSRMRRLAPFFKLRVKSIRSKDLMAIYIGSSYVWPRPARGIPRSGECAWATYRFLHGV
jgi:hypothetical protein